MTAAVTLGWKDLDDAFLLADGSASTCRPHARHDRSMVPRSVWLCTNPTPNTWSALMSEQIRPEPSDDDLYAHLRERGDVGWRRVMQSEPK